MAVNVALAVASSGANEVAVFNEQLHPALQE
jgi:hypothetical protein